MRGFIKVTLNGEMTVLNVRFIVKVAPFDSRHADEDYRNCKTVIDFEAGRTYCTMYVEELTSVVIAMIGDAQ